MIDADALRDLPVVHAVEPLDPHRLRVTVDDAGTALPDVIDAIGEPGRRGHLSPARYRPSFDAVFATLVERDRAEHARADGRSTPPTAAKAAA